MNEEIKIIEQLRNLKKSASAPNPKNEEKFLSDLRIKLSNRILAHSALSAAPKPVSTNASLSGQTAGYSSSITLNKNPSLPWYMKFSFGHAIVVPHIAAMPQKTMVVIFIICFLSFSTIAMASQNSLPGETLYPIKILSEDVRSSLALTSESKAIIHSAFAARRVAEVKAILEQKNVKPEILNVALINLQKNTSNTALAINEESQKGTDVAALAKNINDTLEKNTESLKQIIKDKKNNLKEEETALKNKIIEAKKADDQASIKSLSKKLNETKNIRKSLESSWNKSEEALHDNTQKIENRLEEKEKQLNRKNKAEKTIAEAKKEKQDLTREILDEEPASASPDMFAEFDAALNQAEKSYSEEKYNDAESYANSAILNLKKIEKAIEENDSEEKQSKVRNKTEMRNSASGKDYKKMNESEDKYSSEPDDDDENEDAEKKLIKGSASFETAL